MVRDIVLLTNQKNPQQQPFSLSSIKSDIFPLLPLSCLSSVN